MELIRRVKKIIKWLPILWNDRDWDHHYFYCILNHKLTTMEQFFREDAVTANRIHDADKIKIARILTDRLMKNEYLIAAEMCPERKWGDRKMVWIKSDEGNGLVEFIGLEYEKAKTDKEIEQADRDYRKWGRRADRQREADIKYLFLWIARFIECWWD